MTDQLSELSYEECLELLRSRDLGRLAVVVDGVPMVFPVNYAIDGEAIVIRTAMGTKWEAARDHRVSFEVDEVDLPHGSVWSVLAIGRAVAAEIEGPHAAHPVVPGDKPSVLRITIERATGRRLITDAGGLAFDAHGYL